MLYLLLVSLVWATSFGLIKAHLTALPPDLVNALRLLLTGALFLPFLRPLPWRRVGELAALGALQFGLMYALYTRAFQFLKAHEVALATITTPLFVVLLQDLLDRRFRLAPLGCALLSVVGTALSLGVGPAHQVGALPGLLLIQASNLCFALGQVGYRRALARTPDLADRHAFAWCALGAVGIALLAAVPALVRQGLPSMTGGQLTVLLYLGLVSSGLGFFLWNRGARRVNTAVLAVMNDLKIPLAVAVSVFAFGERAAVPRLLAGGSLVLLAWALGTRLGPPKA